MTTPTIINFPFATLPPLQIRATGPGYLMGRLFDSFHYCCKALVNLALRMIYAFLSLFGVKRTTSLSKDEHKTRGNSLASDIPNPLPPPKKIEKEDEITPVAVPQEIEKESVEERERVADQPCTSAGPALKEHQPATLTCVESVPVEDKAQTTACTHIGDKQLNHDSSENAKVECEQVKRSIGEITAEEHQALAYLANRSIREEKDGTKIGQMLLWVLANAEACTADTLQLMQEFISDFAKRSETREMTEKGSYCQWLETLSSAQLRSYAQLLQIEGSPPPIDFHLKREHQEASLNGQSILEKVRARIKVVFSTFDATHGAALQDNHDFWGLIGLFPDAAAENLQADVLPNIARNLKRHSEFKKLVEKLPPDEKLYERLNQIAPHASEELELELSSKVKTLREHRKGLRKELSQKIVQGVKSNRAESQKIALARKSSEKKEVKKAKSTTHLGSQSEGEKKVPLEIEPKVLWPDEQCTQFLTNRTYQNRDDPEAEDHVFDWILQRESMVLDEMFRNHVLAFIDFTLSKSLYIESTQKRLKEMTAAQLLFFVKLMGNENILKLWGLEANVDDFSQSAETNKISRLKTVIPSLSNEQFQASLRCDKFLAILRTYPKILGHLLLLSQWGAIAACHEREDDILKTLYQLVSKLNTDEDPDFSNKLLAVCHLVKHVPDEDHRNKLRTALRKSIEEKLILCPQAIRSRIASIFRPATPNRN